MKTLARITLLLLLALPADVWAQSAYATISGNVTDPSGAAVPKADVTLKNAAVGGVRKAVTNEAGFYSFPNTAAGEYEITVTVQGFKQANQKGVTALMNQQLTANVQLEIGSTSDSVNVTEMAATINTTDAVRQEGVSGKELNELPLVVSGGPRSAANFIVLLPGVSTGGTNNPFDARINGGLQTGQEAIMDGVSMQQGSMSQSGMISFFDFRMTPDMVSEFKVLTSNYEPQYGMSTSAQMMVETKSGADQFHGGVFEYLRNDYLNARQFGADSRPKDKEHNFGGFLGGPVKIPVSGIFKGKSRTYFYTDIEKFSATGGNNRPTLTLPTPLMKQGNFTEWKDSAGAIIPVYDPSSTANNPGFNASLPESPSNLRYLRTQFPNNTIPGARFSNSLANAWLKYVPDPNLPGTLNNYRVPTPIPDGILANTTYVMARIDYNYGDSDHVYATIWHQMAAVKYNSLLPQEISTENFQDPQNSWVNRVNWSHIFSPTKINHWNIGYLNRNEGYGAISSLYTDLFPKIAGVASANTPPQINFSSGYQGYSNSTGTNIGNVTTRPSWVSTELFTWIKGNHTFKFGGEYRNMGQDFNQGGNQAGTFNFDALTTGLVGLQNSGHPIASFLLEQVSQGNVDFRTVASYGMRQHAWVFHAGDTWRMSRKLSLNYGLRWDVFTPTQEHQDRLSFFDPNGINPAAGGLKGRLAFAGTGAGDASFGARFPEKTWYGGWAPRLGIAYQVDSKTVVRTGYGIFLNQNYYPGWGGGSNLDGFNTNASFSSTKGGIEPAFILSQGFPQNFAKPPFLDAGYRNGRGTTYRPEEGNRRPYTQQWNFTIERQLPSSTLLSLAYVGNKGTRLPSALVPLNALNPSLLSMGGKLNDTFTAGQTSLNGVAAPYANWASQLIDAGCQPTVAQALLPFPQYCDQLRGLNENAGNSTYHSAQLKFEKRFSSGLYVLSSYSFSKLITTSQSSNPDANTWAGGVGAISPFERQRNKSLAQDDVPQVFSLAMVYDLPFGKGKKFATGSGAANYIVGGWSVNLITKYSRGTPYYFRSGNACSGIPGQFRLGCIPATLEGKNALLQDPNSVDVNKPLFDKNAFEPVGDVGGRFYYGQGPRVSNFRGPKFTNTDFSIVKNNPFTIKDRQFNFQIRGESFNTFNQHIFTTASGQSDGGAFERDLSSPNFGMWNGAVTSPRNVQITGRFTF